MPPGETDVGAYIGVGFGIAVLVYSLPGMALWAVATLTAAAGWLLGRWSLGSLPWWLASPAIAYACLQLARGLGH